MDSIQAKKLLAKYTEGKCTPEEKALVERWYQNLADGQEIPEITSDPAIQREKSLQAIKKEIGKQTKLRYFSVAASILFALSIALYLYYADNRPETVLVSKNGGDVPPGGNRATLTFADGSTIQLNENQAGIVIADDDLAYDDGSQVFESSFRQSGYATLTTPRGGQYRVTLPDGSRVWLNASSSLKYPVQFSGNERKVELSGEAYFEVAQNSVQPFIVQSDRQTVQVLGTSFNVNAYTNEDVVTTTLVHGSIRLYAEQDSGGYVLRPGEQALLEDGRISTKQVDVQDYTAWKTGLIVLNEADLLGIIRQIERWYDVEFMLPELPPTEKVYGELRKDVNLSELLYSMHLNYGLNFTLEGRRVIVSK